MGELGYEMVAELTPQDPALTVTLGLSRYSPVEAVLLTTKLISL